MYLLSIVASHLCISKEFGLYYQHLSPYLFDSTGNLESARGLKKRRWGSGKTEQLEADGDSWCVTISFSEVDGWKCVWGRLVGKSSIRPRESPYPILQN